MDAITKYVIGQGFNNKLRELRTEFFSKAEFKNINIKLLKQTDMDQFKKDMASQMQLLKTRVQDIHNSGREINDGIDNVRRAMDEYVKTPAITKINDELMLKAYKVDLS